MFVNWKGMFLYSPDISCALAATGGLAALTGLLRVVKAGRAPPASLGGPHPHQRRAAHPQPGRLARSQLIALAAPTWWTPTLLLRRGGSHAALWAALAGDAELVA